VRRTEGKTIRDGIRNQFFTVVVEIQNLLTMIESK
jgi:hypothetical protein